MDSLQLREHEIFELLKQLEDVEVVLIGGYAVSAHTLPRFSVDCDFVVKDAEATKTIERILTKNAYSKVSLKNLKEAYRGTFKKYEKELENGFVVSVDLLIGELIDRQTGGCTEAEWIFQHSAKRELKGKTFPEKIQLRVIDLDALVVLKLIACRATDIRDVFMLAPQIQDAAWVRGEVATRTDFKKQFAKLKEKISSKGFRDGLQGVYSRIDEKVFQKHVKSVLALEE